MKPPTPIRKSRGRIPTSSPPADRLRLNSSNFTRSAEGLKKELNAARQQSQEAAHALDDAREAAEHPERLKERAEAVATYLPLDFERQKQQLLESLAQ